MIQQQLFLIAVDRLQFSVSSPSDICFGKQLAITSDNLTTPMKFYIHKTLGKPKKGYIS